MDKITIERETLERAVVALEYAYSADDEMVQESIKYLRAALAQKAEPDGQEAALQKIADFGQDQEPQRLSDALLDLDSVEHMQGGANGPTIRLRGFINAQTGPTAPQPPIDNAFVADGCEQFSPPAEPAPVPCCGKYETCSHACTPRGKWLGRREAERAALAAQPAEPVAWLHICVKPGRREVYATVDPDDNKWWPADQWTSHTVHPLYAAPPAPAAVPLTDEQRNDCIEAWSSRGWGDRLGEVVRICIAIERAHGIAAAGSGP